MWILDRHWFLGIVEFQPSGFGKGSYLNVCAHLLWHPNAESLSFDIYQRVPDFINYIDDDQFAPLADKLAQSGAHLLSALTNTLRRPIDALPLLAREEYPSWQTFHAAMALGVSGRDSEAVALLTQIAGAESSLDWFKALQLDARCCADLLRQPDQFRAHVMARINRGREHHGLKALEDPLAEAA